MEEPIPLTQTVFQLQTEIKVLSSQVGTLSCEINSLKQQNEARRANLEAVANTLRTESKMMGEAMEKDFQAIITNQTAMSTEFKLVKWIVMLLTGSVITLMASKLLMVLSTDFSTVNPPMQIQKTK